MKRSGNSRNITSLVAIGLVLIGLLSGILGMMLLDRWGEAPPTASPIVERVELGSREPMRSLPAVDSSTAGAMAGALTLNRLFKQVADQVTPAVVYIQVESTGESDVPRDWFHNFDEDTRRRFFRDQAPRQSVGSGVVVSDQGYIVTNHHVVEGAERINVTFSDKRQFSAKVIGIDPSTDLAVIRIEANTEEIPVVRLGDSDQVEVGEWVLAVGNPFRLTSTVTAGIVSALGRQVNIIEDSFSIEDFIQTDAAINPGNSGGALVNLNGELVGISTAIATESGSYEGYGFAVPSNLMERVVSDLIAYGEVQRGYLGVTIQEIDARAARQLGLESIAGVYVNEVRRNGAAFQAGLRDGDVVLSIDGLSVNAPNELQSVVARRRPGEMLAIEVWRRGQRQMLDVELLGRANPAYQEWFSEMEQDQEAPMMPEVQPEQPHLGVLDLEGWGLGLRDVRSRERDAFEVDAGAYVAYVEHGGVAWLAGLPRDVVILRVGNEDVDSAETAGELLTAATETDETAVVRVKRRDGVVAFYEIAAVAE